jgi:hypothetical protein
MLGFLKMENNRDKILAFESIVWYSVVAKVKGGAYEQDGFERANG